MRRRHMMNNNILQDKHEGFELYMWFSGEDAPVNNKWVSRINNFAWNLTNVTHNNNYYQFNTSPTSNAATSYGSMNSSGVDLKQQFIIEATIQIDAVHNSTKRVFIVDLSSFTSTKNNGTAILVTQNSSGSSVVVGHNTKVNGNVGVGSLNYTYLPYSIGNICKVSSICSPINDNQSQIITYFNGSESVKSNPFNTVTWNSWGDTTNHLDLYIGRGTTSSSSNPSIFNGKIFDIKIYRKL